MTYSTGEVANKLRISKDSLRYYEKEGLLPPIERELSGHRVFSDSDVDWIFLIRCLRDTDMPIIKIKEYVSLLMMGGRESILSRRNILLEHELFIKEKIVAYQNLSKLINKKIEFYDEALSSSELSTINCMDYAAEWKHFRTILEGVKHD